MKSFLLSVVALLISSSAFAMTTIELSSGTSTIVSPEQDVEVVCKSDNQIPVCIIGKSSGYFRITIGETFWDSYLTYNDALAAAKMLRADGFCK